MTFGLTVCTPGQSRIVEIPPEEFETIKRAKASLITLLGIEEKFDALLENYAEYERDLYQIVLEQMLHQGSFADWSPLVGNIFRINRRLVNLLAMTRLYTDQVKHDLAALSIFEPGAVNRWFSNEYDSAFAYRFMEALRNHIQHRGLPPIQTSYPLRWEDRGGKPRTALRFGITVTVDVRDFRENTKFKPSVLAEIPDDAQPLNLTILVRKYVESFNRIHEALRQALSPLISKWTSTFLAAFERSREQFGERQHIDLVATDKDGGCSEQIAIVKDLVTRIEQLQRRNNPLLKTLSAWHISSEIVQE